MLRTGERPVTEIVEQLAVSQPAVSKHLRVLREAGLVTARVDAQRRVYRLMPQKIVGEWAVGAPLKFVSEFGDFEGQVLAYEPSSVLEFRWGTDTIRLEVAPDGDGSRLTLLDTFAELGKAARDAAGWHTCLDALEQALDGTKPSWTTGERWPVVHRAYVEQLGPEASTIGPPEGAQAR